MDNTDAKAEREAIVKWLRECETLHLERVERGKHIRESRHHAAACRLSADAIERGQHLQEQTNDRT